MNLGALLEQIEAGPKGPEIGAFFDLDGTLVTGHTINAYYADRLRHPDFDPSEAARTVSAALEKGLLGLLDPYLAGARIDRVFPFGPLPAVAVMAAMVSHTGRCCIGPNVDATAVDDPDLLLRCFSGGLDEVLSLTRPEGSRRTETPPLV